MIGHASSLKRPPQRVYSVEEEEYGPLSGGDNIHTYVITPPGGSCNSLQGGGNGVMQAKLREAQHALLVEL